MAGLARTLAAVHLFLVLWVSQSKADQLEFTPLQLQQLDEFKSHFEVDHEYAYTSNKPVFISGFAKAQKNFILERFGAFFSSQPTNLAHLAKWGAPSSTKAPPLIPVCPAITVQKILYTGINVDDEPVAVVQFGDVNQWVIWQQCSSKESPHISLFQHGKRVECSHTVRSVPMVVFRLPISSFDDVTVQHIKIKACTSHVTDHDQVGQQTDQTGPDPFDHQPLQPYLK
ncbi:uncharacterized protein LOC121406471 [Lytechinus variegatus]|uniref:uncharacterized protein LOC121406471 n=1 Tax=Lytechinus variegatus TaxID=7654 RepID=UPI001BB26233|nr:uncharacterized protein LOC121406471 [Lytechinus variegatus]